MPQQTTEIIAIGDELTTGQRLDTNSQWLAQQLTNMGLTVQYHSTVADNVNAISDTIRSAIQRSAFIVVTGGLGPTSDDLTREALSQALKKPLIEDKVALQHIVALFRQRGREMSPNNKIQALMPETATLIHNAEGTAPGIDIMSSSYDARIFCLPGVPAEMKMMFESHVVTAIQSNLPGPPQTTRHYVLKTFGIGESNLEHQLPEIFRRDRNPIVGITASHATITLRIQVTAESEAACHEIAQPTIEQITNKLGNAVYADYDIELGHKVCQLLYENSQSVATWECATQGQLAAMLQDPLHPALVASRYNPEQGTFPFANAETEAQLINLANEFRKTSASTYAIVVGPVRYPHLSEEGIPSFDVAIASEKGGHLLTHNYTGHPDILLTKAAKQAINQLRLHMNQPQ